MRNHRTLSVIILIIITALVITFCTAGATASSEEYIPSESQKQTIILTVKNPEESQTTDKNELLSLIQSCQDKKDSAHSMAEGARSLGYKENNPVIVAAGKEWFNYNNLQKIYQNRYDKIIQEEKNNKWNEKYSEYPAATTIWLYFKNLGYNDYVCAGIVGNLMAEVGGQTLNIQYWLKGNGYYGMCQWNTGYKSQVWGADLNGQLDFLANTIKYEINTFGFCYYSGFDYNNFLELNDAESAAKAFAKCYERCGSQSVSTRQNNALTAYNYFTN